VESVINGGDMFDAEMFQLAVERMQELCGVGPVGRKIEVDDLPGSMDTSIGATTSDDITVDMQGVQGRFNGARDGVMGSCLSLKSLKKTSIIREYSFDAHQKNLLTLR